MNIVHERLHRLDFQRLDTLAERIDELRGYL